MLGLMFNGFSQRLLQATNIEHYSQTRIMFYKTNNYSQTVPSSVPVIPMPLQHSLPRGMTFVIFLLKPVV